MGEQGVEEVEVPDADVGEGVVVDGHAAAQPAEGVVLGTEGGELASGADALQGGEQPQGDGQSGVEGGASGPAFAGADGVEEGLQVEPAAEVPDDAGLVVGVEEPVDGGGVEYAVAIRGSQAGWWQRFRHERSSNGFDDTTRWRGHVTRKIHRLSVTISAGTGTRGC